MSVQRGAEGEGERDKAGGGHTETSVPEAEEIPLNHGRQNEISGAAGQGCAGVEEGRMTARVFPEEVFEGKYSLRQAVEPVLLRIQS